MQHVKSLMLSRPVLGRIPDQSIIVSEIGDGDALVRATRCAEGGYAFVYTPLGNEITVSLEKLSGRKVKAWWYDPRHGTADEIGLFDKKGDHKFKPPVHGKGNDWVLVLDDALKDFSAPGETH